jgi:predicted NBD/HSP70 family sugar kinase
MSASGRLDSKAANGASLGVHGALRLPAVEVDSYNLELKDNGGFVGDRVSKKAFYKLIEKWREPLRKAAADPFGKRQSEKLGKKQLDMLLAKGDPLSAGFVHSVIEEFAQEFASVVKQFLKDKAWQDTECIFVGGGMSSRQIGTVAMGRAEMLLKADDIAIPLTPIRHHADDAGLIGAVHLAPPWIFEGQDAILAVDIGGTNIRAGVVRLNAKKASDFSKVAVWKRSIWRHREDKPKRDEAVDELANMLKGLIAAAEKANLKLAPLIGVGCPGKIASDGSIDRGAQNLPGNWESSRFNLPQRLYEAIPKIGEHETHVLLHNDAVVQGLSQVPFAAKFHHWAALTLGTGLGNVRFSNRLKN